MVHVIDCAGDLPAGGRQLGSYNPNCVVLADSGRVCSPVQFTANKGGGPNMSMEIRMFQLR